MIKDAPIPPSPFSTLSYGEGEEDTAKTPPDGTENPADDIAHSDTIFLEPSQPEKPDKLLGMVVDNRYKIERVLGQGAMGRVYEAYHIQLKRRTAVKVLSPEGDMNPHMVRDRFDREVQISARLEHQNIVRIHDCGILSDGMPYLAMEYLKGKDLGDILEGEGRLTWGVTRHILLQICKAMDAAHAKGIIHRDLKPGNIFLIEYEGDKYSVKILDFGIAKSGSSTTGKVKLTQVGAIMGTPNYMSPEQAQSSENLDRRSDIYSLGVIMYEMLTGTMPFTGGSHLEILQKHVGVKPEFPRKINPDIPKAVEEIILKAMAKDPSARYQNMDEMAREINKIIPDDEGDFMPPAKDTVIFMERVIPTRNKIRSIIFAVVGLAALGGAGLAFSHFIGYSEQTTGRGSLLHKPEPDAGTPRTGTPPTRQDGGLPIRPDMGRDMKARQPDISGSMDHSPVSAPVDAPDSSQKSEDQSKQRDGGRTRIRVKKGTQATTKEVETGLKKPIF